MRILDDAAHASFHFFRTAKYYAAASGMRALITQIDASMPRARRRRARIIHDASRSAKPAASPQARDFTNFDYAELRAHDELPACFATWLARAH